MVNRVSNRNNQAHPGHARSRSTVFPTRDQRAGLSPTLGSTKFTISSITPPGVFHQPPRQGDPQRQEDRGGFQNNPKQLKSGQYHVFTTSTWKRDHKVKHRTFSIAEPALPPVPSLV